MLVSLPATPSSVKRNAHGSMMATSSVCETPGRVRENSHSVSFSAKSLMPAYRRRSKRAVAVVVMNGAVG